MEMTTPDYVLTAVRCTFGMTLHLVASQYAAQSQRAAQGSSRDIARCQDW